MTAREYMSRAYEIDKRIRIRRRRLEYLKSCIGSVGKGIDGMPKGPSHVTSVMEEQAIRIVDLENAISADERNLVSVRTEIAQVISRVGNETLTTILQMRYLDYMKWEDIMASLGYCRSYLYELHGRALQSIGAIPTL